MIKNIARTLFTKLSASGLNFLLLIITSRFLGAEIRGEISLLILAIAMIVLVSEIVGGPALVYLIPRIPTVRLMLPAYSWAIVSCLTLSFVFKWLSIIPENFNIHVLFLALLMCFNAIHLIIILGKEKIKIYNVLTFVQTGLLFVTLCLLIFVFKQRDISSYLLSLYISYTITFCISALVVFKEIRTDQIPKADQAFIGTIFKNGLLTQLASIAHLLSNRVSFFFLNFFLNMAAVGVYSTGLSLAEAVLIFSGSISMVLYSRIANSEDEKVAQNLTKDYSKFSFLLTIPILTVLMCLPENFYTFVFGQEFHLMKTIIIYMSPGIMALSFSSIYAHYFSGTGKYHINTIAGGISLFIMIVSGWILIPTFRLPGAAIASSIANISSAIFLFIIFKRKTKIEFSHLLPGINDFSLLKKEILQSYGKRKG